MLIGNYAWPLYIIIEILWFWILTVFITGSLAIVVMKSSTAFMSFETFINILQLFLGNQQRLLHFHIRMLNERGTF